MDLLVDNITEQIVIDIYKANTQIPTLLCAQFRTGAHPMVSAEVVTNLAMGTLLRTRGTRLRPILSERMHGDGLS